MVGPTLILDKSTFQSLSLPEYELLEQLFSLALPPVLGAEILANLAKPGEGRVRRSRGRRTRLPEEVVADLARKFRGSGPVVCTDYAEACLGSLMGQRVPTTGQIPVAHGQLSRGPGGAVTMTIEPHPINYAIMRWSAGEFSDFEAAFARVWRAHAAKIKPEKFRAVLYRHHIISRRAKTKDALGGVVSEVFMNSTYQSVWLEWILEQLGEGASTARQVRWRWSHRQHSLLQDHAPYAAHCVRAMLALDIASRSGLTTWKGSHAIDVVYLFYMPFSMVFSSNDRLHRLMVPILLRENQSFIEGRVLKAELRALLDERGAWAANGPPAERGPLHVRFKELAPAIYRAHSEHLYGGPKARAARQNP